MPSTIFEIPIRTISEANCSQHWTKKSKRHKQQQLFVRLAYAKYVNGLILPCIVTMTRLAPRILDDDNLCSAFKWIRDELSESMLPDKSATYVARNGKLKKLKGRADSDERITWKYSQEKNTTYGVRIVIEF